MRKVDAKSRFIPRSRWIAATTETREGTVTPALHRHEGCELVLVESGACTLRVEERRYAMRAGDCALNWSTRRLEPNSIQPRCFARSSGSPG